MEQLSIFDLFPEETDIESMTTADIAKVVGEAIKMKFYPSGWEDEYEAKVKKLTLSIHKEHYLCDTKDRKEGNAFIGCGWSLSTSGAGSPIDSVEDAIKYFKRVLGKYERGEI